MNRLYLYDNVYSFHFIVNIDSELDMNIKTVDFDSDLDWVD